RLARSVHVRGVDHVHTEVERPMDDVARGCVRVVLAVRPLSGPELPAPDADRRQVHVSDIHVAHVPILPHHRYGRHMRVAVTGSHGFIGSALVPALERAGHDVVRVARTASGDLDVSTVSGTDAVVHLAGESVAAHRWTDEHKRRILESRTRGTSAVAEAIAGLDRRPSVLLSGSAIGYYGDRGNEVLTEQSPAGDGFLADV